MCSDKQFKIGDVYMMWFDGVGSEQHGMRPGVIFSNNVGNKYSPNVIALPMTSSIKKVNQPTHVVVKRDGTGLAKDSMVLCENPERMSKDRIGEYITTLSMDTVRKLAIASVLATSAIAFIEPESLINVWEAARSLNS